MTRPGFPDLRAFLDQLRRDRDLAVIEAAVDPRLEAAEVHRRVIAAGGPPCSSRGPWAPEVAGRFAPRLAAQAHGRGGC